MTRTISRWSLCALDQRGIALLGVLVGDHTKSVSDSVHIREVGRDLVNVKNVAIAQATTSHIGEVSLGHGGRSDSQLHRVVEDRSVTRCSCRVLVVINKRAYEVGVLGEADQTGRVVRQSIVAAVDSRNDDADHLSLDASYA